MDGGLIVVLPELSGTMGGWVLKFYLAIAASVLLATPRPPRASLTSVDVAAAAIRQRPVSRIRS